MQRGSHPFNFWFISVLGWIGVDRAMTTENMSARLYVRPHIHDCVFFPGQMTVEPAHEPRQPRRAVGLPM
jgi:hypothetical protein